MDIKILLLGFAQGLLEFLPISSSTHLALLENLLYADLDKELLLSLNAFLHLGSLLALLFYFRKTLFNWLIAILGLFIGRPKGKYLFEFSMVVLASIPTALIGLYLKLNGLASLSFFYQGLCLLISGYLMVFISKVKHNQKSPKLIFSYFILGMLQGLFTIPGLSRSGLLFAFAMLLGFLEKEALRLAFLLAIPAIIGANILALPDLIKIVDFGISFNTLAFLVLIIFLLNLCCLNFLEKIYTQKNLGFFGVYCQVLGYLVMGSFGYFSLLRMI